MSNLSNLQSRARAKGYRYKAKGASDAAIVANSPLLPWREVQKLTPIARRKYELALQAYTNRNNANTVLESGELMPTAQLKQIKAEIREHNRRANEEVKRIDKINAPAFKTIKQRQWERGRMDSNGVYHPGSRDEFGVLVPIQGVYQPPASRWAADRRLQSLKQQNKRGYSFYRTNARMGIVKQLIKLGRKDLANKVRNMRADAFDVLANRSDIWEYLGYIYESDADMRRGSVYKTPQSEQDRYLSYIERDIRLARKIGA